ncbi:Concanavalin A-like lectins/glucanase [Glarea lozoyensis ATCC 20868]|uniref:Concanavalin A-like lectins/glucanase n=1 Tax=Glarea lozoyensis (strain ATCC 20868 / MF5171) TaxID=1116229 RepID=S3DKM5_GLAL2|nr:Concanavalin A-like lectins/glucanase [Glarea lozoyensis ATCC 20868]EPE32606.1 Concanavalin A-like lectins/glucanase [Glarea lozoyensis ATCC 20868]
MPTGAPGFAARRSSYASVVSGTASGISQPYQQASRSGALSHLLNQSTDLGNYDPSPYGLGGHIRHDSRTYDMDFGTNGASHRSSGSWNRGGHLPSFSSAYGPILDGNGFGGTQGDSFFVPSYLRGSKYVQRLEESYKAREQAHVDGPSTQSQSGSLSTSGSSTYLQTRLAPSHRGMTYDLIEKAPPFEDENLAPLPSKWNSQDKFGGLEVMSDGQEVKLTGPKPDRDRDHEASSIGIGFSSKTVPLSRLPGWEPDSWAYHGDDGHSFGSQSTGKHYGPPFTATDVIGCGVNFRTGSAFFTKNGDNLGVAFREIKGKLFPSVGMKKSGEHIRVNFGQSPFVFDIDGMMSVSRDFPEFTFLDLATNLSNSHNLGLIPGTQLTNRHILRRRSSALPTQNSRPSNVAGAAERPAECNDDKTWSKREDEKRAIHQEIASTSTAKLAPPMNETDLIQSLVLQFLTHDGYIETARAFADEVHSEKSALALDKTTVVESFSVKEDKDAGHRQQIRTAVLEGDIDKALKYTDLYYPAVLQNNEHVLFRLRCRKFTEMVRRGAEMLQSNHKHTAKKSNGQNGDWHDGDWHDDVMNQDMEMDNQQNNNNYDRMDTEEGSDNLMEYNQLTQATLNYGQDLERQYRNDPSREVSKALSDAFSLIAYQDPLNRKEVSHLVDPKGRVAVAEELNAAILLSLGKSSSAALEKLYQQTAVLLEDLRDGGGSGAFVNIDDFARPKRGL